MGRVLTNFTTKAFAIFRGEDGDTAPRRRLAEPVTEREAKPYAPPNDEDHDTVPTGTAAEIVEWVGGDAELAQEALDAELANANPRKGLSADLQEIINAEADEDEDDDDEDFEEDE